VKAEQNGEAFPVCLERAKQGDVYAQNIIGVSYASGNGVTQDAKTALVWFRRAATQGFAKAQSNLALAYLNGNGVERDNAKAVMLWRLAAIQGEPNAQFNLAVSYANGYSVNQDRDTASKLLIESFFSYLKQADYRHAFRSTKYIRIHLPWFKTPTACYQPLQAGLQPDTRRFCGREKTA